MQKITPEAHAEVINQCLQAYLRVGTMERSLDQLGAETGTTKRMLVHYFGNRQEVESRCMSLFQSRLEGRFQVERFAAAADSNQMILMLWDSLTEPEFLPMLRLTFDIFHRAATDQPARELHSRVLDLWTGILARHTDDPARLDLWRHLLQGAALSLVISGDSDAGRHSLERAVSL